MVKLLIRFSLGYLFFTSLSSKSIKFGDGERVYMRKVFIIIFKA